MSRQGILYAYVQKRIETENGVFAVCDGMGGESDGEIASRIIVDELNKIRNVKYIDSSVINEVIDKSNSKICNHITKTNENSGSTFVSAIIQKNKADIYNIGDSRCYLIREKNILQLTKDHTLVAQMIDNGKISKEEAKKDRRRHQLTQHLGIFPEDMTLSVHHKSIDLQVNDILLLCSDGVTDGLSDEEILLSVQENEDVVFLPMEIANKAMKNGSSDNVTAMIVNILDDPQRNLLYILYKIICVGAGVIGALLAIISLFLF